MFIFLIGGSFLNFMIFYHYKLSAGVLTLENYYVYSVYFNKPYTKLPLVASGCWMGQFYLRLLEYRKIESDDEKKAKHGLIYLLHNSTILSFVIVVTGLAAFNITTLIPFEENKDAYLWTTTQNSLYTALSKFGYITPLMGLLTLIFCGRLTIVSTVLRMPYHRPFSRLTLGSYLVYPIVIMMVYTGVTTPVFLSVVSIFYLYLYNFIMAYVVALVLFCLIQSPLYHITSVVIYKYRTIKVLADYELNQNYQTQPGSKKADIGEYKLLEDVGNDPNDTKADLKTMGDDIIDGP